MLKHLSLVALLVAPGCGDNHEVLGPVLPQSSLTLMLSEDGMTTVDATATDPDGLPMEYTASAPAHGVVTGTGPIFTYTSDADYNGTDAFTITISDGQSSVTLPVTITVTAVDDPPVAEDLMVSTHYQHSVAVMLTATDVDSTSLTYTIVAPPQYGALTGTPPSVTYTPNSGYVGLDTFTYQASDGTLTSSTSTVTVTVISPCGVGVAAGARLCD